MHTDTPEYGNWPSPINASLITRNSSGFDELRVLSHKGDAGRDDDERVYFLQRRPHEDGRHVIVTIEGDNTRDMIPAGFNARSRVHEYGGGSYTVDDSGLYFVNDSDQDIYHVGLTPGSMPRRITTLPDFRFADMVVDQARHRLLAVAEQHQAGASRPSPVINMICAVDLDDGSLSVLAEGHDFYACPRISASGTHFCWQYWDFPAMPWDSSYLCVAAFDDSGQAMNTQVIAGDDAVSVFQPSWAHDRECLFYIADDTGWWHVYEHDLHTGKRKQLSHGEREIGQPQWVFCQSSYCVLPDNSLICSYRDADPERAGNHLLYIRADGTQLELESPWQEHEQLACAGETVAMVAASSSSPPAIVHINRDSLLATTGPGATPLAFRPLSQNQDLPIADDFMVNARRLHFCNRHGQQVFANYYAPRNPDVRSQQHSPPDRPPDSPPNGLQGRPPMIVICHGGPTGQSSVALDARKLYWTSRGFALLDVDYSGSTGYGRNYRERLNGLWGKLDVEDCCDAAMYAVSQGLADADKLIIRGSSAGGLTVLAALCFHDVFAAGASYYGISDLVSLAGDTHKFESRYTDNMLGPYPQDETIYKQRSPINHYNQLQAPVIFFQGLEDRVVPKEQAELMVKALDSKGMAVAAQYFEGEQHGFRKAETVQACLQNELAFYRLVLALSPAEDIAFSGHIELRNVDR